MRSTCPKQSSLEVGQLDQALLKVRQNLALEETEIGLRREAAHEEELRQRDLLRSLGEDHRDLQDHLQVAGSPPLCRRPVTYACSLRLIHNGVGNKIIVANLGINHKLSELMLAKKQ